MMLEVWFTRNVDKRLFLSTLMKDENADLYQLFSRDWWKKFAEEWATVQQIPENEKLLQYYPTGDREKIALVQKLYNLFDVNTRVLVQKQAEWDTELSVWWKDIYANLKSTQPQSIKRIEHRESTMTKSQYFEIEHPRWEDVIRVSNHGPMRTQPRGGERNILFTRSYDSTVDAVQKELAIITARKTGERIKSFAHLCTQIGNVFSSGHLNDYQKNQKRNDLRQQVETSSIGLRWADKLFDDLLKFSESEQMRPYYYEELLSQMCGINPEYLIGKIHFQEINAFISSAFTTTFLEKACNELWPDLFFESTEGTNDLNRWFNAILNYSVYLTGVLFNIKGKSLYKDFMQDLYDHKREVLGSLWSIVREVKKTYKKKERAKALFIDYSGANALLGFEIQWKRKVIAKPNFGTKQNREAFQQLFDSWVVSNRMYPLNIKRLLPLKKYAAQIEEHYNHHKQQSKQTYSFLR